MPALVVNPLLRRSILPVVGLIGALFIVSCSDALWGNGGRRLARVSVQPRFPEREASIYATLKAFNLSVTTLQVALVRPGTTDTVAQKTVSVDEGQDEIVVELTAEIEGSEETLVAQLEMRSGEILLFSGSVEVLVRVAGSATSTAPVLVPVWVGPGREATRIRIAPRDTTVAASDHVPMVALAFDANGAPVLDPAYTSRWEWRVTDPTLGGIPQAGGDFVGAGRRGVAKVVVFAPNLLRDTVSLTLVPPATQLRIVSGDNQSAAAGVVLPQPLVVEVLAADNLPVPNAVVTFSALSVGASVAPPLAFTNTQGRAQATATLSPTVSTGPQQFRALVAGLTPVVFSATGLAGAATSLSLFEGDIQAVAAGTALPIRPSVRATDVNGNPVSGVHVVFAVTAGGGAVTGGDQVTNADGVATVGSWTLGQTLGVNTMSATAAGLSGSPVTFTATGLPGNASTLAVAAGAGQSAIAGSAVPIPPMVRVTDVNGNPVANVTITFAVSSGGGSVTGASRVTASDGTASVGSWVLGSLVGINRLTASAPGLIGSPLTIIATGIPGPAAAISVAAGNNQQVLPGAAVGMNPTVRVSDANGNAVGGVEVTFAVVSGGGSISGAVQTTSADGLASVGSWVLGNVPGVNTLTADAPGLAGSPVLFSATALSSNVPVSLSFGGGSHLAVIDRGSGVVPPVTVVNSQGSPLSGIPLTFLSRNSTIASVDASGAITGTNRGQTVVLASVSADPSIVDSVLVVVAEPGQPALISSLSQFDLAPSTNTTISVFVDMRASSKRLASTTIDVSWNPAQLQFQAVTNGASGVAPTVNSALASTGTLTLAMADAAGFSGRVELLRITFRTSATPITGSLTLTARELTAADYTDLLAALVQVSHPLSVH